MNITVKGVVKLIGNIMNPGASLKEAIHFCAKNTCAADLEIPEIGFCVSIGPRSDLNSLNKSYTSHMENFLRRLNG
jgi:hypothetical protein